MFFAGQSLFKYAPRDDWILPAIANAVGDCQFVFVNTLSDALAHTFLTRLDHAFAAAGLDAGRHCVMLPMLPHETYLGVAGLADVILDPPGWSGGRSTLDFLAWIPRL